LPSDLGFSEGGNIIPLVSVIFAAGRLGTLFQQVGWVALIVLFLLLGFSLFSWAIIFQKYRLFSRMQADSRKFLAAFRSAKTLPEPKAISASAQASPLVAVYGAGYRELAAQTSESNPHGKLKSLNAVTVAMQLAASEQVHRLESRMAWLATTGSVTPFIGLFGTVWGVMDAFIGLGTSGASSIQAVAPGIAEALVATAAGLFTAIPAVIAYNHFLVQIRQFATQMDNFTLELSAHLEKHYSA
jgi:biopolymer transport protein TolQ